MLSNSISSTIYQSQLRFTFALADVSVRLAVSPRSLQFRRSELNCWGHLFSKNKRWGLVLGGDVFDHFPPQPQMLLALQPLSCRPEIYPGSFPHSSALLFLLPFYKKSYIFIVFFYTYFIGSRGHFQIIVRKQVLGLRDASFC